MANQQFDRWPVLTLDLVRSTAAIPTSIPEPSCRSTSVLKEASNSPLNSVTATTYSTSSSALPEALVDECAVEKRSEVRVECDVGGLGTDGLIRGRLMVEAFPGLDTKVRGRSEAILISKTI